IYRIPETLSQEVLTAMYAPAKPDFPTISADKLPEFDAFIFGIPTRYGNFPAQWKTFWDTTGQLWAKGALAGKYVSAFVSTASPGGGQESTVMNALSTFTHHGMIFVPLGYSQTFGQLTNLEEVHGGSPWGAGTFAGPTGARQPSALELEVATPPGQTVPRCRFQGQVLNKPNTFDLKALPCWTRSSVFYMNCLSRDV
ncbi:protoplast-secreted protein 2 precursor, partial [Gymnopus androsaceus JB14]